MTIEDSFLKRNKDLSEILVICEVEQCPRAGTDASFKTERVPS